MSKKIKIFLLGCALMLMCCVGITVGASEETKAKVIAHNLTITDGGINVNFYVEMQGDVEVTLNGNVIDNYGEKVSIIVDAKAYNCYKFTQPVVAKKMDQTVSLIIESGDIELVNTSYSVNNYVDEVIEENSKYGYNHVKLAEAMTYYGEFSEVYFGYEGKVEAEAEAITYLTEAKVEAAAFADYGMKADTDAMATKGITYKGTQLNLKSEIILRLLFEVEDSVAKDGFAIVSGNSNVAKTLKKVGDYYCLDIENIGADALDKAYTITYKGEDIITNCSALSYAKAVVEKYADNPEKANLVNVAKALYLYNKKADAYVESQATAVYDIFYGNEGFSATPDKFTPVYLTSNDDVTTESTGNQVTTLSQLNDSRTKGCSVWMKEAYELSGETLTGPYVIRRYTGNTGNVLNVTGTATFETTVDGSLGKFIARYPGGTTDEFDISKDENSDIYVSGALTVKGNAKSGVITTSTADITITADGLTEDAEVIFQDHKSQKLAGTGETSAIELVEHGQGHFGAYETAEGLKLGSVICGCGANISQDPNHSCGWVTAHGLQAAHDIDWKPWTPTTSLPNSGSYYLTQEEITGITGRSDIASNVTVNLDLAGCKIKSAPSRTGYEGMFYRIDGGTLNIADSSKEQTGAIKMTGTTNTYGSIAAWGVTSKSTYINIFGGTISTTTGTVATLRRGYMNMYGGTILPGAKADDYAYANAVQVGIGNNQVTDLKVFGGTIKGEVLIYDHTGASLSISNDAKVGIADGEKPYGISTTSTVTTPCTITCTDVTGNIVLKSLANLDITGTGEGSAFTVIDSRNKVADDSDEGIGNLVYEAYMCVCGKMDGKYDHTDSCKQPDYAWQPWTSTTGLPTENGSYYLTQNLTGLTTRSQIADGKDINLDLAGYTVEGTGNGGVLYRIQHGSLNLADSSVAQTGAIKATGESTGVGRALYVWGNQGSEWNANIFGGTLTAETGTPVAISRGNINMYGGNIKAGTSVEFKLSDAVKFATANSVQVGLYTGQTANLNVKGGNITGEVLIANETSSTVAVSNNVKVGIADEDDAAKAYGIGTVSTVTSAQTIACNDVATDASVVIKNLDKVGVSGTGEESAFTVLEASRNTITDDNPDGIGNLVYEAYMCVCGEMDGNYDHTDDCKKPLSAWKALNSWNISTTTNGSYYLVSDLTANSTVQFDYYQINIDLAGHTIDGEGSVTSLFAPRKTSVLNITDSVGGGVIKNAYNGESTAYGTVIFMPNGDVNKSACTNLYAGTLTAEGGTLGTNSSLATVYIGVGTFNMYGGYVEDNLGDEDNFKAFNKHTYNYTSGTVLEDGIYIKGGEENTFRAGFGKTDISPENGVSLASYGNEETRLSTGVLSPLEAVATVVTDEEDNTLILVVTDLSWGKIASANQIRELVYKAYGIPYENVLIGGTHNHSAPNPEYTDNELNVAYIEYWKTQVMSAIRMAMRDRKAATMEIGTAETENMVYSRRYLCQDGKYVGGGPESYNESEIPWWSTEKYWIQAHESEADEEIQMVRFVRDGENVKDILITQWQSHACNITSDRSEGSDHYKASGEWPQIIRSEVEKNLDVHCMYMQGAAGNLASMSRISTENLYNATSEGDSIGYNDYVAIGKKVASYVIDKCKASDGFQAVESGLIQTNQYKMPAMLRSTGNPAAGNNRAELNTVAIGDVSLVTLPSELFDTSGKEIKEAGKDFFKMTLIMGYTCGKNLYEAPAWAVEHGCYEVEHGRYQLGTAEIMVEHYIDTLEELYNIKNNIQEPIVAESPEEAKVLKVLTLGHSLGLDSGHLLNLICDAQGIGDYEEVVIGTLYHSGCTMAEHTSYMLHKSKEYDFYLSSSKTPNEPPTIESGVNLADALAKDYWDIVVMQDGVFDIAYSSNYTNGNSHIIQRYINKNKLNTRIRFAWHMTWVAPTDNTLRDKYPYEPNSYYTNYEKFNHDRTAVYNAVVKNVTDYVVTDKSFDFIIPSATAFENALSSYLEETDIHRDYVHATDLGRVIASYTWYCKLMGIDQLEEIKLSAIPVNFFKSTTGTEDLILTDKEKAVILESVNNALANPLKMTQSQYTQ